MFVITFCLTIFNNIQWQSLIKFCEVIAEPSIANIWDFKLLRKKVCFEQLWCSHLISKMPNIHQLFTWFLVLRTSGNMIYDHVLNFSIFIFNKQGKGGEESSSFCVSVWVHVGSTPQVCSLTGGRGATSPRRCYRTMFCILLVGSVTIWF